MRPGPFFRPPRLAAWSNDRIAGLLILAFIAGAVATAIVLRAVA